ncbi:DUF4230 domain-containing protein [Proteocatella sphenisci]|uniref:DUF4230 domain-containing protein n=1 Tax=Proteocatella sphenisci TaxID=181070 RepID=UPI00048AECB8|nr:DUF4230 domain-containing protein [Proteocatella sphenisci]
MKKLLKQIILIVVIGAVAAGATFVMTSRISEREIFSSSGVMEQVKNISELNTVEMYFNEIIDFKNAKLFNNFEIPFTKKSFIFTVKARVKAGIDLSSLEQGDIKIEGKKLVLRLAAPVVTSGEILSYKAYDEKDGLFNEVTTEDTLRALELFEEDLKNQAKDNGIIEKAKENAEKSIGSIFMMAGYEQVDIIWK